ncbi:hypothetical protein I4U23_028507 [Adineta vaga]|nr:hypothetical protein I4U23_028507 [Adineta vaga]
MINVILFVACFIISGQTITVKQLKYCEICIINSKCTDDTVRFNISISKHCLNPLNVYFKYTTDVNRKPRYYNTTTTCTKCYTNIEIDTIRGAWDYVLTLVSPTPLMTCPTEHVAHCGGKMSRLLWYITGGLSALSLGTGFIICGIKYCRTPQKSIKPPKKRKTEVAVINT